MRSGHRVFAGRDAVGPCVAEEGLAAGLCLLLHPRHSSLAKTADDTRSGAVNPAPTSSGEGYSEAAGSSCRCRFSRLRRTEEAQSCGRVVSLKSTALRVCQSPAQPRELLSCIDALPPCTALPASSWEFSIPVLLWIMEK